MVIELFIALFLGIIVGTLTGLTPGIHINLIAVILTSSLSYLSQFPSISLAAFIVSMSITHTFVDFIPSIFLGAPNEDTFLSVLPGHQMLKEGKGYEAIVFSLYGSLTALLIIFIFTPAFIYLLPIIYNSIKNILPFVLIFVSFYLIFREEKIILSIIIFALSGILGFLSFNLPVKEPLLPLLTGLFGVSSVIVSLQQKTKIPKQEIKKLKEIEIPKKEYFNAFTASIISAPFCSFLPGVSSGHAATIGSEIIPQSRKGFIVLLGAINTIMMGLSFIALYSIDKGRSGSAVAIKKILKEITFQNLILLLITLLISGIIAFFLTIKLAKLISNKIEKINYTKLSLIVLLIIFIIVAFFSNTLGLLILVNSTALGIFTIHTKARRINLMGCLIIPTILFYLF